MDGAINPVSENIEVSKDRPIERVARGGSWFGEGDQCRVTYRASFAEDYKVSTLGFRIVRGACELHSHSEEERHIDEVSVESSQEEAVNPADFSIPEFTVPVGEVTAPAQLVTPESAAPLAEGDGSDDGENDQEGQTHTYPGELEADD